MRRGRSMRGQRGVASVEALILVPFFFIVWGCAFFMHRTLEKKMVVNEIARTCAWEQMTGGCGGPGSSRCQFSSGPQLSDEQLEGSRAAIVNIENRFLGFAIDFRGMFGPAFRPVFGAERRGRVSRPRSIGGGDITVGAAFSAMCNETPGGETVASVATGAFCQQTGWCP
ncbi:MAG TPA: hypothetical protein VK698_09620 [Kofleriaceae bacterium]|nr:hypothetical protein [Kofleriaceae bacterium]